MTDQSDLDLEAKTTEYILDTILDTVMDTDMTQEDKEDVIILHLEELQKRSRIYDIMRQQIKETVDCGKQYELTEVVEQTRKTLKIVEEIEKEIAPSMIPWN